MRPRKRQRLNPDFADILARSEISIAEFVRECGIAESTVYHLLNPALHPERRGGMHRTTAWKIANAYARLTQREPQDAYEALIIEEELTADGQWHVA